MKLLKYISIVLVVFAVFTSCEKNFEDINANVDDPATVPSSMLIGTALRDVVNELYSTFNGLEHGETWIQHISMVQYNDPERYKPRTNTMDNLWARIYTSASQANQMQLLALEEGNSVNQGIALTIKAMCFLYLTDFYGDIPFSEALKGPSEGEFTPAYDSQADVYAGVLTMLDEAMTFLNTGEGATDPNMDIMYAGDASKWLKFATSLKFRAVMRMSGKMSDSEVTGLLQPLVNSGNLFESNDDEAKVVYLSESPEANPIYETIVAGGRAEFKLAQTFVDHLKATSDPRLAVYAQPAVATGEYVGKPSGFEESPLPGYGYDDVSAIGTFYLEATSPGYFLSYTELLFLMAEAAKQGWISGGETAAQEYYEAAILNSLTENGVGDSYASFIALGGIAYNSGDALKQIGTQKWAALFCQGWEAWTEWRRVGYPVLTPAADGYINEIPSRLEYESNEVSINGPNYQAAVTALGGDGDELTTPVWWMN